MKFYEKNGLDMEIILLRGSGQTSQAIIGGSIFASPVTTATLMTANLSGADLTTVAHTVLRCAGRMLVKPEIRKAEDLKGKKVASSGLGSLGDFMYRVIMRKYGLNPDQRRNLDYRRHAAGTAPGVGGRLRGCRRSVLSIGCAGRKDGLSRALGCARRSAVSVDVGGDAQKNHSRRPRRRDADDARPCRRHSLFENPKGSELENPGKYLRTDDRELLEGSYDIYSKDFISTPYPIVTGLKLAYEHVAQRRPEIHNHKPEEFVDPSFVAELDKSGFIKKLYAQK